MKRISRHSVGIDSGDVPLFSDFQNGGPMWQGTGPRERRKHVQFAEAFRTPPTVHAALSLIDMDSNPHHRADLTTEGVTEEGFELVFRTWGDSRVARIRARWMAIGELPYADDWNV